MSSAQDAATVVGHLRANGFEAYWVGGCVRDTLLGNVPKDYDVATNAKPSDIERLFPEHYPVGKSFGVMIVSVPSGGVEVATYRSEEGYSDRRRPDQVVWSDAKGDVLRRDFTINGLLYDPETKEVIDYVEGQRDLALGLIRAIGVPSARFAEDPLRILRAVRLKNTLGFQYDRPTYQALHDAAPSITHISMERIGHELSRMFGHSSREQAVRDLDQIGLLQILLPEVVATKGTPQPREFHKEGDVFEHLLLSLKAVPADAPSFLAWAALLHDVAKPLVIKYPAAGSTGRITTYGHAKQSAAVSRRILTRLRQPNTEIEVVEWLIANHMSLAHIEQLRPAKREQFVLDPRFPWLLELHHADAAGALPVDLGMYNQNLALYKRMKAAHAEHIAATPPLLLDGHDLIALGVPASPKIPELLEAVRNAQLVGKVTNKETALAFVRTLL
ncbi:MAG: CCA tRNA nucleotidyltransferase [Patescibacteria group bacterium]